MSPRVIFPLSYKDTSDHTVDAALTKLKCPGTLIGAKGDFGSKRCQLFGSDNEPLSVAASVSDEDPSLPAITQQGQLLKKAE